MSSTVDTENLTDRGLIESHSDPQPRVTADGQLARVGRRQAPRATANRTVSNGRGGCPGRGGVTVAGRRCGAGRPVRREDLFHQRAPCAGVSWPRSGAGLCPRRARWPSAGWTRGCRHPAANSRMNVATVTGQRGGVGKTSLVVSVGGLLADLSRLNVVAVDADLDYGPLADHVPDERRSGKDDRRPAGRFRRRPARRDAAPAAIPVAHPDGVAGARRTSTPRGHPRAQRRRSRPGAGALVELRPVLP